MYSKNRSCWKFSSFFQLDVKQVPSSRSHVSCKVTGTRINRGIGVGLEIPIGITFGGKETATEWHKKALHHINMMIEEKVFKYKK